VLRHPQRSWSKINQVAALSLAPGRQRLGLYWRYQRGKSISADTLIDFLRDLLRHLRGPVILILDNLPTHRRGRLPTWAHRRRRLHLEYFPAYAPELNPCEFLFAHQKRPLANHGLPDLDCLFDHVDQSLQESRHRQDLLRSFIGATPLGLRWPP
jgi:hypothetical protein